MAGLFTVAKHAYKLFLEWVCFYLVYNKGYHIRTYNIYSSYIRDVDHPSFQYTFGGALFWCTMGLKSFYSCEASETLLKIWSYLYIFVDILSFLDPWDPWDLWDLWEWFFIYNATPVNRTKLIFSCLETVNQLLKVVILKKKRVTWPALGTGKIWILVADWSRFKSSEPNAGHVTRKIGPLYFTNFIYYILSFIYFYKQGK